MKCLANPKISKVLTNRKTLPKLKDYRAIIINISSKEVDISLL